MNLDHHYRVLVSWEGNLGSGTSDYRSYSREHLVSADGLPPISGSSDRTFHGDSSKWNPEQLLLAALSQCHMLSYLHVAASRGIIVTDYRDDAVGTMRQTEDGGGHFTSVTLRPVVTIAVAPDASARAQEEAGDAHTEAAAKCFIGASVNFPVEHEPTISVVRTAR